MLDIRIVIGIFAILHSAYGACTECTAQYTSNKTDAESDVTLKCNAVKDYVTCLEGKLNDGSCTLDATEAQVIQDDLPGTCNLSAACTCQKDFFKAVTTCSAAKARISCLKGQTDMACDETTTVSALVTNTETYINGVGSCSPACTCEVTYAKADISTNEKKCMETKDYVDCLKGKTGTGCVATDTVMTLATAAGTTLTSIGETDCPLSGTTCECEVTYAKADISSDANMCTALKNEISCLVGKTEDACDGSTPVSTLSATVASNITGTSGCIVDENCQCEIDYVKTVTQANKCSKTKALATCIQYEYDNGCGSERTRDKIGSYIQTTITDLGNSTCPVTETCQCQIDFAKASVTSAKKCSSARAFSICIGNVNNAKEFGCDGVTVQDFIKTNSSAIQKEFCSASGLPVASLLLVLPAALFYL